VGKEEMAGIDSEAIKDEIRMDYWTDLEDYQDEFPFHRMGLTISQTEGGHVYYDHIEDN